MLPDHDLIKFLAGAGMILSGFSYSYWLRQVAREVNKTLPENKRLEWDLLGKPRMTRWFWAQHEKLFPESRTRAYAMLSIVLFFLIGLSATTFILIADSR
jgi:hypothetical protein